MEWIVVTHSSRNLNSTKDCVARSSELRRILVTHVLCFSGHQRIDQRVRLSLATNVVHVGTASPDSQIFKILIKKNFKLLQYKK